MSVRSQFSVTDFHQGFSTTEFSDFRNFPTTVVHTRQQRVNECCFFSAFLRCPGHEPLRTHTLFQYEFTSCFVFHSLFWGVVFQFHRSVSLFRFHASHFPFSATSKQEKVKYKSFPVSGGGEKPPKIYAKFIDILFLERFHPPLNFPQEMFEKSSRKFSFYFVYFFFLFILNFY